MTEMPLQGNERILFVDDEEMLANVGSRLLESLGYTTTKEVEAQDALETFKLNPGKFDLVITDQSMPKMTGTELSTELLKIRPEIPIILYTGGSHTVSLKAAQDIGIREICYKPLDRKQLAMAVRKVLDENEQLRYE